MYKFPLATNKVIICTVLLLAGVVQVYGQEKQDSIILDFWEESKIFVPLLQSQNATALAQLPFKNAGNSRVMANLEYGGLHRVQQPKSSNIYQLLTEKYQKLNNMSWYGRFSYQQAQDKDISYNLVMDPYRGTPYIMADSIGGNWTKQLFELEARTAYQKQGQKLLYGLGILYQAGMGAKQLDPRPMNYVNSLTLSPSLRWLINKRQNIGLTVSYGFRKENVSIAIRNTTNLQNLYRLKGLGIHDPIIPAATGASRNYNLNNYAAELQYQLQFNKQVLLTSIIGLKKEQESATDGSLIPYPAGDFANTTGKVDIIVQKKAKYWQELHLRFSAWQGSGTEYHTKYDNTQNKYTVIFSGKTYLRSGNTAGLTYSWMKPDAQQHIAQKLSISLDWQGNSESYNIVQPSSQSIDNLFIGLGYQNYTIKNWRFKGNATYQHNLQQELIYTPNGGTNLMAKVLLYPDFDFLNSSKLGLNAEAKKLIKLPSTPNTTWYVLGNGQYQKSLAPTTNIYHGLERWSLHFGIGIYY